MKLNSTELKHVAGSSESSKKLFGYLANRERNRDTVNIRKLAALIGSDEQSLIQVFKKLEGMNIGHIQYNTRNRPVKFHWHYALRDVGKSISTNMQIAPLPIASTIDTNVVQNKLPIVVRNGKIEIEIPVDLKSDQFEAILRSIKGMQQ